MPIDKTVIAFVAGFALASYGGWNKLDKERIANKLKEQQAEVTHANAIANLNTALQQQASKMQADFSNELKKQKSDADAALAAVSSRTVRLRDKHSKSPWRCTDSRPATGSARDSTGGAELSQETAQFLIRLARDADQSQAALRQCVAQYQGVKAQLEGKK